MNLQLGSNGSPTLRLSSVKVRPGYVLRAKKKAQSSAGGPCYGRPRLSSNSQWRMAMSTFNHFKLAIYLLTGCNNCANSDYNDDDNNDNNDNEHM
jgi:hypothetical protein